MSNENAGDDVNCHSLARKNSNSRRRLQEAKSLGKNTRATDGEDELKFFIQPTRKRSKVERTLRDTSFESSHNSSSSSGTENEDPDDEDFKVESYSFVSEESGSSFADEGGDEDSSLREVSEEKIEKTISAEHVMKEKPSGKDKQTKVTVSQGISERGNRNATPGINREESEEQSKYPCAIADEEAQCTRERTNKKVKENPRSKKSKPIHSDEVDAVEYELYSKEKACGKKRKTTSRRVGDGICTGVQADRGRESNGGCHDQTCLENACQETNKNMENFKGNKIEQRAKKEKFVMPKQNKFVDVLFNSIIGQGQASEEQANEPKVQQSSPKSSTLPKIFRFEDEEPKPAEKSEEEKMVEALFDELAYADMCTSCFFALLSKHKNYVITMILDLAL